MDDLRINRMKTKMEYLILVFLCLASFTLIAFTGYYSNHAFDLTDEGFYINSIIFPHLYSENFTLFGFFIIHFFFSLKKIG